MYVNGAREETAISRLRYSKPEVHPRDHPQKFLWVLDPETSRQFRATRCRALLDKQIHNLSIATGWC